jgi:hypothetical protein
MAKATNPFVVSGRIEPEYFCDRQAETAKLKKSLSNGNNVTIMAPWGMGKQKLVQSFCDLPEIKDNCYTFNLDISCITDFEDFVYRLGYEIYRVLKDKPGNESSIFINYLDSIYKKLPQQDYHRIFCLKKGEIEYPELLLNEIFNYLRQGNKRCIITLNEFQKIADYQENNVEALLHGQIQKTDNCNFIYICSDWQKTQSMFLSGNRPFYMSAETLELKAIPKKTYSTFVSEKFHEYGKRISQDSIGIVYDTFKGNTFYMQRIFNDVFASTEKGALCSKEMIETSINEITESYEALFKERLRIMDKYDKEVLFAIAQENQIEETELHNLACKYSLHSTDFVRSHITSLLKSQIITNVNCVYSVGNQFFRLWLVTHMDSLKKQIK